MWLTPPAQKIWTTRRARGGKCGRSAEAGSARDSRFSIQARARPPIPPAVFQRKWRRGSRRGLGVRLRLGVLTDIEKLRGIQQNPADVPEAAFVCFREHGCALRGSGQAGEGVLIN